MEKDEEFLAMFHHLPIILLDLIHGFSFYLYTELFLLKVRIPRVWLYDIVILKL